LGEISVSGWFLAGFWLVNKLHPWCLHSAQTPKTLKNHRDFGPLQKSCGYDES
jgi:hypothetical protein